MDLDALVAEASAILDAAAKPFVAGHRADSAVSKRGDDFGTKVDLAIERQVVDALMSATGIGVHGEEFGGTPIDTPWVWVLDPVDGTFNYAAGSPMAAILLGLLHDGKPVAGLTWLPFMNERYSAVKGGPLLKNGVPQPRLAESDLNRAIVGVATFRPDSRGRFPGRYRLAVLEELSRVSSRMRMHGATGIDLAYVADGVLGGALNFGGPPLVAPGGGKGVNFENRREAGDPVELAAAYDAEGADELTFLDVTASSSGRVTMLDVVRRTAEQVFIPLTVGGGVRTVADVDVLLRAGADKVSVNTAAIARPDLLAELATQFGSQCIVLSVDARTVPAGSAPTPSGWEVTTHRGRRGTGIDAVQWAARGAELGVGEILLNSMDADGTKAGFDLPMLRAVRAAVGVPVIASGGAGAAEHFAPAVAAGADAVLAASVFHFRQLTIGQVKAAMAAQGVP